MGEAGIPALNSLSPRERDVLLLLRTGMLTPQVASSLGISVSTLNKHLDSVRRKLGVDELRTPSGCLRRVVRLAPLKDLMSMARHPRFATSQVPWRHVGRSMKPGMSSEITQIAWA
jgi:transposase